jgi:hypothetical protein
VASSQALQFFFQDGGTPNTGKNYGPFNVNPINKLFEVEVRGALVFANTTVGTASTFEDYVCWGVQVVAAGTTPVAIDAGSNDPNVLISEVHVPDEIVVSYNPTSSPSGVIVGGPVNLTWRGQKFISANSDLYFQTAGFITPPLGWAMYGTLNLRFS